jgi:galactan 5-O-arabinofuranosyltransferase
MHEDNNDRGGYVIERAPSPESRTVPAWLPTVGLIVAGAATTAAFQLLIARTSLYPSDDLGQQAFMTLVLVAASLVAVAVGLSSLSADIKGLTLAIVIGALISTLYFIALKGTPFGINGLSGDATFRTALVVKSSVHTWPFADFGYSSIASWYPPLYYWTLGKVAAVSGIEPYRMIKFGAMATAYIAPVAAYLIWRYVTRRPLFGVAAAAASLILIDLYKPSGWISMILFVGWWLVFMEGIGARTDERRLKWFVVGGLLGAFVFQIFYYYFVIGGVSLLITWLLRRLGYVSGPSEKIRDQFKMIGTVAAFSAPYWLPYVVSMVITGGTEWMAGRWFTSSMVSLPLPFLNVSISGGVMLVGLGWLLWASPRNRIARALLMLVIAAYVWYAVGFVMFILDHPLFSVRSRILIEYALTLGAMFAAAELFVVSVKRVGRKAALLPGAVALAVLIAFFGQQYTEALSGHRWTERALATEYPTDLVQSFTEVTGGDYQDKVLLSSYSPVTVLLPVFNFNVWNPHYANPAGEWRERIAFITESAELTEPEAFAAAIFDNEFAEIDYIMPERVPHGYRIRYQDDAFPHGLENREIFIRSELLESEFFEKRQDGSVVLFVPRRELNPGG